MNSKRKIAVNGHLETKPSAGGLTGGGLSGVALHRIPDGNFVTAVFQSRNSVLVEIGEAFRSNMPLRSRESVRTRPHNRLPLVTAADSLHGGVTCSLFRVRFRRRNLAPVDKREKSSHRPLCTRAFPE